MYHGTSFENALNIIDNGFDRKTYWTDNYKIAENYANSYPNPVIIKLNKKVIIDLLEPNYTLINYYEDNIDEDDNKKIIDEWYKSEQTAEDSLIIFDSAILNPTYLKIDYNNIIKLYS